MPLLEAMAADVPVLAYASTAVPDTLGGAGVQFAPKDLEFAAELLGELAYNDELRARVIAGQRRRLRDFGDARLCASDLDRPLLGDGALMRDRFHRSALRRRDPRRLRYHCRLIAERLAARHDVDVLTTCARDYITWKNEYPEGTDRIRGVTVRRFANAPAARHPGVQPVLRLDLLQRAHAATTRCEWLEMQGPWCPALLEYLDAAPPARTTR